MAKSTSVFLFGLIWFISFASITVAVSCASEVDKDFVKYTDNIDNKYFPIFLETNDMIKNNNYANLSKYYTEDLLISNGTKKSILISELDNSNFPEIYFKDQFSLLPSGYKIKFPINWSAKPIDNITWLFYFTNLDWLNDYLSKGENGDQTSSLIALKIISDWLTSNPSWPPKHGDFTYDDHGTALRLQVFYRALRLYNTSAFKDDIFNKLLLTGILNQIAFIASEENYNWNNHGIIMDTILLRVLNTFNEFKPRKELQLLSIKRLYEQYSYAFTVEGIHKEHSSCYHLWVSSVMLEALDLIKKSGQPVPISFNKLIDKSAEFYTYILKPDGAFPAFGDCTEVKSDIPGEFGNRFYAEHPEITYSSTSGQSGVQPKEVIKVFPKSGYAIFRDKWPSNTYAAIKAEFHSFVHYHEDETSFILSAFGHDLLIDPGIYTYDKNPLDFYYKSAKAHNLLIVDDRNFNYNLVNSGLSGITRYSTDKTNPLRGIVELTHVHYNDLGVKVFRQFGQIEKANYIVKDIYESKSAHKYSQLFHLAENAKVEYKDNGLFKITWDKYPYIMWLKSNCDSYRIVVGSTDPVQGWYFPAFAVAKPEPVMILDKAGTSGEILTLLSITNADQAPDWSYLNRNASALFKEINSLPRRILEKETMPKKLIPPRKKL